MSGTWWQIRQVLIVACVATLPLLAWRGTGIIAQTRRDRLAEAAYARGVEAQMDGRYDAAAAALAAGDRRVHRLGRCRVPARPHG
jgi:hypothetical protein